LIQLFPPDDERLSLETCRGRKINTLKKVKKCVKLVVNPEVLTSVFLLTDKGVTNIYRDSRQSLHVSLAPLSLNHVAI
jgi:hypothetical protein